MKLSEQLEQDFNSGDSGVMLDGCSERAKRLEDAAWGLWHKEACNWGASIEASVEYANKRMREI